MITPFRSRVLVATILVAVFWAGCRESDPVGEERNRPPETYLVQSPAFNEAGYYLSHLFWDGFDPDGRVSFYEVAVTDSAGIIETAVWHPTFRSDSLVRFGVGGPTGTQQVLHHRFFVRAVDNLGRRDPDPAWILFQAKDFDRPTAEFTVAEGTKTGWPTIPLRTPVSCASGFPPDTLPVGANVRLRWRGVDDDSLLGHDVGDVVSFEYKLSPIESAYKGGTPGDTAAIYSNLPRGTYTFFVRPTDEAGWAGESCRYFQVNYDPVVTIVKPFHPGLGEPVSAYRIATTKIGEGADRCAVPVATEPWSWEGQNLPAPPFDLELHANYVLASDTLGTSPDPDTGWWIEFDVTARDPDGTVQGIEVNVGGCSPAYLPWAGPGEEQPEPPLDCSAVTWACAPTNGTGTVLLGPLRSGEGPLQSGDWQVVVAAVDDQGQRGAAGADTLTVHIDRSPFLSFDRPGIVKGPCDHLQGIPGDTITVCGNDTLYVIRQIQGSGDGTPTSDTPCATATAYAETGAAAALDVTDYQAFPKPGEEIDLAFAPPDSVGRRLALLECLFWARDRDGTGWMTHARWDVDKPPTLTQGWERAIETANPNNGEFTPLCFTIPVVQTTDVAEHALYIEIRDWLESDLGPNKNVAERTTRYVIPFTTTDISGGRYAVAGRARK